ncbi:succinate-semialdehyde dehydrogenase / glutarate-semialdehyde dehydrogenase [Microbulbifer donghaiensis]|uniref:Succinate-semialdehyde dehydrogenase / glutarate-semialdehyde dehydrogenase n=1 Tax=Microbulbifer donghaiensis TaxID=494016 RepID=A0A1M4UUQ2_9GAMM|nr:NAD-dependent succinate-semialdehyde dehydrogenase [Microbulbifer donghaiensis]SHE60353.1 succinate-semialdehyde dehydrogenase / glutarate-semialdehyde dehydrogenase [Microbulbifer donghaiensis]
MTLRSVNPYNNELLATYEEMSPEEIDAAIGKADEAFKVWKDKSFSERASVLRRAAELFRERKEELAQLMAMEMGKKLADGRGEIELCAEIYDFYADEGEKLLAPQKISTRDGEGTMINQPVGIIYGIQPWNFPFYQPSRCTAPNLIAGNVVITKHASNVPQCAKAFEQLMRDAGAPEGTYTNLVVSARGAGVVIDDDRVQGVSFTGSNAGGAKVAEQAGRNVKKTVMELGGVDPFIVLDDADMDVTVERFLEGKLSCSGQICIAAKRIILVESIADEFLTRVTKRFQELKAGDPLDESTGYGPLCTEKAAIEVEDQINRSVASGATVTVGGKRDGAFIEPTILTNIGRGTPAFDEEIFGPVACVFIVKDEAEAIALANDSQFGLGGSVYTTDEARGVRVAEQIESGTAFVNHISWTYSSMPMGGVKKSGYGRELGHLGIMEFVNQKLIRTF